MKERQETCSRPGRSRRQRFAAAVVLLALATPGMVTAQPWSGQSTLGVLIRGAAGPVAGAVVEIRHRGPGLNTGPEARRTDSRGQVNFVGIADGRWNLEIKHPDYLSFVASVNVKRGKKPEILTQFLEASGPGRSTLRVKFLRSDQVLGEVIPGTASVALPQPEAPKPPLAKAAATQRPVATPAPEPPPEIDKPAPDPADTESTETESTETSNQVDSPAVPTTIINRAPPPRPAPPEPPLSAPEPTDEAAAGTEIDEEPPTPTAEVRTPHASPAEEPAPVPEAEAEPAPTALPAMEAPTAEPTMRPALEAPSGRVPEPADVSPPEAAPLPHPVPPANARDSLRAYRDRTCFECKPGEWAASTELEVASGEACRPTAEVAVRRALRDVAAVASEQLAGFAGPLALELGALPLSAASAAARNTLAPYLEQFASCRFLAVVVPRGSRFMGFHFEARDAATTGACMGGEQCEIGQAKFVFSPAIARGTGASIAYSLFENTGTTPRTARFTGFFLPASGWTP